MTQVLSDGRTETLWTVHDVATYLQASVSYVYKAAERGDLPRRRLGALLRFVPTDIRAWAEGHKPTGKLVSISRGQL